MTSQVIPDEAIEAAAEALVGSTLGDRRGINWEEFFEAARLALNAAAPYIQAAAWDEGFSAGEDVGNWYAAPVTQQPFHTNPYRTTEWPKCPPRTEGAKPHCPDCSGIVGETGIV